MSSSGLVLGGSESAGTASSGSGLGSGAALGCQGGVCSLSHGLFFVLPDVKVDAAAGSVASSSSPAADFRRVFCQVYPHAYFV